MREADRPLELLYVGVADVGEDERVLNVDFGESVIHNLGTR